MTVLISSCLSCQESSGPGDPGAAADPESRHPGSPRRQDRGLRRWAPASVQPEWWRKLYMFIYMDSSIDGCLDYLVCSSAQKLIRSISCCHQRVLSPEIVSLKQWFLTLSSVNSCPACFRCLLTPTHLIQMCVRPIYLNEVCWSREISMHYNV